MIETIYDEAVKCILEGVGGGRRHWFDKNDFILSKDERFFLTFELRDERIVDIYLKQYLDEKDKEPRLRVTVKELYGISIIQENEKYKVFIDVNFSEHRDKVEPIYLDNLNETYNIVSAKLREQIENYSLRLEN